VSLSINFVIWLNENFAKVMAKSGGKVTNTLMEFTSESKSKEYFPCVVFVYLSRCCIVSRSQTTFFLLYSDIKEKKWSGYARLGVVVIEYRVSRTHISCRY